MIVMLLTKSKFKFGSHRNKMESLNNGTIWMMSLFLKHIPVKL